MSRSSWLARRSPSAAVHLSIGVALALSLQIAALAFTGFGERRGPLVGDEVEYWSLAAGGLFSLHRPPGYPLFLRASVALFGDSILPALLIQCLVLALRPLIVIGILGEVGVRRPVARAFAFALAALSFTALSLSERVVADALFGTMLPLAVFLLLRSRGRPLTWLLGASAVAAAALLMKPIGIVWLAFAPTLLLLCGPIGVDAVRSSVLAVVLPVVVLCIGVWLNGSRYGIRTYSSIGELAVRRYWLPASLALQETGGHWDDRLIERNREAREVPALLGSRIEPAEYKRLSASAWAELRRSWRWAARALLGATWLNLPRPFFPQEAPTTLRLGRRGANAGKLATYGSWLLAGCGALVSLRTRHARGPVTALLALGAAFVVITSTAFWEGARLLFPVEWLLPFFGAMGIEWLLEQTKGVTLGSSRPGSVRRI